MQPTLRDVVPGDLLVFFEHQRDPEANRMAAFPARDHEAFMRHWRTRVLASPDATKQTIVVDGQVAGNVVGFDLEGERLVGYWIGRAFWGRGVATAAVAAFIAVHERRRPLHAYVATSNVGSIRVLDKCGFRPVGRATTGADGVEELRMRLVAAR